MSLQPKIIISGGGTGGHVFPAIAIANAIKTAMPKAQLLFVGLWISGLQRKLTFNNLSFPFKVVSSLWKSWGIIQRFKPQVAVGVGGYASGPLLQAAALKKIPIVLQEQNSYPGITNKLLAKHAAKICVVYDGMEQWFPEEKIIRIKKLYL